MAIQRPRCQFKGAPPHPAKPAYMLVWKLPSGDVAKFSCAGHRLSFGGKGCWINKVEGFWDDKDASDAQRGAEDKPLAKATCVDPECGKPAPYDGAWCNSCQSKWEDEQRTKARTEQRSINVQRGF